MINDFQYAIRTRRAWWFTATSRTKARFARTILGSFWLGLSNLLTIAALGFVYGTVFSVPNFKEYFIYLGIGLVIWNSISFSIISSPQLFTHNAINIKNLNIRPIFYTLEEWAFQLQSFFQSFILVLIILSFLSPNILINSFTTALFPLLNLLLFLYWFPLIICLIGAWFTDFIQLVPIVLQILFLVSPILYQKENLGDLQWITEYNILYKILEPCREAIIFGTIDYKLMIYLFILNLIGIMLSVYFLKRQERFLPFLT